jgi:hypothetical protein
MIPKSTSSRGDRWIGVRKKVKLWPQRPFFPAAEAFTSLRQGVNNAHGFYCNDFNSPLFLPSSRRNQVCDSPAAIRLPEAL